MILNKDRFSFQHTIFILIGFILISLSNCTSPSKKTLSFSEQMKMLKTAAYKRSGDTSQVNAILRYLERQYHLDDNVESLKMINLAKSLSEKLKYDCGIVACNEYMAGIYLNTHQFDSAKMLLENDSLLKKCGDEIWKTWHQLKLVILGRKLKYLSPDTSVKLYLNCARNFEDMRYNRGLGVCFQNIGMIYLELGQTDSFLHYTNKAVNLYEKYDIIEQLEGALRNRGVGYYFKGNLNNAIEDMFRSTTISEIIGNKENQIITLNNIAVIYNENNQFKKCEEICRKILGMMKPPYTLAQHELLSSIYTNLGTAYNHQSDFANQDSMIRFAELALFHLKNAKYNSRQITTIYNNYGYSLSLKGNYSEALKYIDTAFEYANSSQNSIEIANNYISRGNVFAMQNKMTEAINWNKKAVEISQNNGDFLHLKDASENLKGYFHASGNCAEELKYATIYFSSKDSFESRDKAVKFAESETQKTYELKIAREKVEQEKRKALAEKEAQNQRIVRNSFLGGFILTSLLAFVWFRSYRRKEKDNEIISKEKERSENLLLNILPAEVAEELKSKGESEARDFDNVTVIFTDFKSFTQFSEQVSAKELVSELNTCFRFFDGIMEKYGIEKIKTIGDSYMAAAGLGSNDDKLDVKRAVLAGLEMQDFIQKLKKERESIGNLAFDMRVGIHTGPVVAGIVGIKKFAYDIWGDTVNTASRMESSGQPGKVNISEFTYDFIKEYSEFSFIPRGKIMAKGKGEMEMYFVEKV